MTEKRRQKTHTYKEYREKYGKKFDNGKLEFVSLKETHKLNKKKKYWKIEDKNPGYYEVSKKPWLIPIIVIGSVAAITAAVVPAVLLTRPQPSPSGTVDLTVMGDGCKVIVDGTAESSHKFTYTKGSKPAEPISLTADTTYSFPDSQTDLPTFLTYTKNTDTAATLSFNNIIDDSANVTIKAEEPTGDRLFTFRGTNCTLNNDASYPVNTDVNLTLEPDATYSVPKHIAVKIDDIIQTEGEDYTYTPSDTSASLSLKVTGDVEVEALAPEKNLALVLKVKPTEQDNSLGFAFQCTPKGEEPDPAVDNIEVDWGEGMTSPVSAPSCIDNDIIQPGGMFEYINSGMQGSFPTTGDFQRHTYNDLSLMPEDGFTVKFYGDINNIAFGFPHPDDGTTIVPWGTANKHITSITTYCDFPAEHINSSAGQGIGIDFDTYVVLSNEEELTSVNFALGTTKIPNGCCCKARGITSVDIQDTVTEIGDNAFCEAGLTQISIPDSVTKIGYDAFKCLPPETPVQLTGGITFGENSKLEEIGVGAFARCGFQTFDLPKSVTTIYGTDAEEAPTNPAGTFSECLLNYIVIDHILSIGKGTFNNWTSNQKIYFPNCVDEDEIITNYGDPTNWKGEATLVPHEYPLVL